MAGDSPERRAAAARVRGGAPVPAPSVLEGLFIGAPLTFADRPLYRTCAGMAPTWGITTIADQQVGGSIMWVPGGMFCLVPPIGLLAMLLRSEERTTAPRQPGRRVSRETRREFVG